MKKKITLKELFEHFPILSCQEWKDNRPVRTITSDTRNLQEGDIFVACRGPRMNGHDFLGEAFQMKPSAVVVDEPIHIRIPSGITVITVEDSRETLAELLLRIYDRPDQKVKLIGVTGTNGKTTVTTLLYRLLSTKAKTGYVGTLKYCLPVGELEAVNTTPGAEQLIPLLAKMVEQGAEYVVMEVSSHALTQKRVYGLHFDCAVFTQLTQDHLDYHGSMERYYQTKRLLFSSRPQPKQMLINVDCPYGRRLSDEWPQARTFSLGGKADFQVTEWQPTLEGAHFKMKMVSETLAFQSPLPLRFNVMNSVAALSVLKILGFDLEEFQKPFESTRGISGRMEAIETTEGFRVFIDYAHTPDAFEQVLSDVKQTQPRRVLALFGCGGDRDREKRAKMTQIACAYSDVMMLTTDNPRSEDPEMILLDMHAGIDREKLSDTRILECLDRKEAIDQLIGMAESEDVVLILGKGHEDYQILGDQKIPFSDKEAVQDALKARRRVVIPAT